MSVIFRKSFLYTNLIISIFLTSIFLRAESNELSSLPLSEQSMSKVQIREATIADSSEISLLLDQLGYSMSPKLVAEKIKQFSQTRYDRIWVAQIDTQVCGVLALQVMNPIEMPGLFARIDALSVDQSHRRSGIGKALVNVAEGYAQSIGCFAVVLTSRNHRHVAHEFYKNLGYKIPETTYFTKRLN